MTMTQVWKNGLLAGSVLISAQCLANNANSTSVWAYTGVNCIGEISANGCVVEDSNSGPTASAQQLNVIQQNEYDSNGDVSNVIHGNAAALSNLADGSLHVTASSGIRSGQSTVAYASWQETVYFNMIAATAPVEISFGIDVNGTFGGVNFSDVSLGFLITYANGDSVMGSHGLHHSVSASWQESDGFQYTASNSNRFILRNFDGDFDSLGPTNYSGRFALDPGKIYSIDLYMQLFGTGNFDFGNSAHFRFNSPIPFTSQSGVFLTQAPNVSAVPLPAALPLLISGLGALGVATRRRTKKLRTA